ncbi:putative transposase [Parabacteroides sp. PFB2-12]|uniref:IS200/IS605 family transposase n=1 Tax=unclassified Parabacteroides TaxID=2649774 RepID=UPI00247355BD|nr:MULTISPECIES: IS200/IS605 family transposase [unclassified Parabacteroides]MDH6343014.1 putative transposase [Parabacteroides sp. PM6-13]MDH6390971.1 putative transposase [Parabacteroides sp. PFB2-12]
MANTYGKIYLQLVFAVKKRESLIKESIREEIQKYMTGVITNKGCKLYAIYINPDHVHMLVCLHPAISVSTLVRDIKSNVSKFINEKRLTSFHFQWQEGYGVFSYSASHVGAVVNYILNQPEHHKKRDFKAEYMDLLQKFGVEYDEQYLFDWILST